MNNEILEPKDGENPPQDVIPVNYEKLSNALRRDMHDASEELLTTRSWLVYILTYRTDFGERAMAELVISSLEQALSALDCYEYLEQSKSDSDDSR